MGCKTYRQIAEELKDYLDEDVDLEAAIEAARNASWEEKVDAYEGSKSDVLDMLNSASPWLNKQRIEVTDLKKTKDGYDMEYKYMTSSKLYKKKIGEHSPLTFSQEGMVFSRTAAELDQLMSDKDFINEGRTGYEQRVTDMMNNPEQMKEVAKELAEISNLDRKAEKDLLDKLDIVVTGLKGMIPAVNVLINKEAKKTGGAIEFSADKMDIYVGIGTKGDKSPLEVYVHELIHAATKFAIDSKDPELAGMIKQMEMLREKVVKRGKLDDDTLMYISDPKVGLHEFVAYAMTNPEMVKELKQITTERVKNTKHSDWASQLAEIVRNMIDTVTRVVKGPKYTAGKQGYAAMIELVSAVAMYNNRQMEAKRNRALESVVNALSGVESNIKKWMDKGTEKVRMAPMPRPKNKGLWESTKYLSKLGARALVDENAKRALELTLGGFGVFKPEGTIMSTIRDMSESDSFQDAVERLGLISQSIDQQRELQFTQIAKTVQEGFDRKLTDEENEALASVVLDTDLSAIWNKYDNMEELIGDDKVLKKELKRLKDVLKSKVTEEEYSYMEAQANGLGYYMVTGKGSLVQMLNAHNIARMLSSRKRKDEADPEVEELVDVIATLEAIRHTASEKKAKMVELMREEENGVNLLVAYQEGHKDKSRKELFNTDTDKMKVIKGYSKELFDKDVNFKVAPRSEANKLKRMGWKKVDTELGRHKLDDNGTPMAMYVTSLDVKENLHRVALRYTDTGKRGTSIREGYAIVGEEHGQLRAEADILKMEHEMYKISDKMMKGNYTAKKEDMGITPVLGNNGRPADFRYMMDKETKKELLKMDRRVANIVGRMYASTYDKSTTKLFNKEAMKMIVADAKKNYKKDDIAKNAKEYININKNSNNEEVRELWRVIPEELKKEYKDGFTIRRDMMHSFLGYRELSISNAPGFKFLPEIARNSIKIGEKIWKEVIKVSKVDIIIRVPAVIIGNIISNGMYSVMSGFNPMTVAKVQLQGIKELTDFIESNKKLIRLQGMIDAGRGTKQIENEANALRNRLENSSVKELMDEGFYMTIVEELGIEEFNTSNKITEFIDNKTKNLPSFVNDGIHMLYISDKTKLFKSINMATQYSDFVARYAQYHLMLKKGADKEKAIKVVRDAFINYNKPNSRLVEYFNQMGFLMFTKYFTRIQKAIKYHSKEHPMKVLLAVLGQEIVIGDIDDMYDQSLFVKDLGNLGYDPLGHIIRAITPSGAEAIAWAAKGL